MTSKLIAKMYRMKMLSDVREFVESLPFDTVEKQVDQYVYTGVGEISTGLVRFKTTVKIAQNDFGKLFVVVTAPKAGIEAEIPFDTEDQRKRAPDAIRALIPRYLN
jgi:hypothetical protein